MATFRIGPKRFWRPLIGVVVAYAVAAQSLLIALGGFALPAQANGDTPAFELCLHDTQGAPELPARNPDYSGCTHCIFCFAGSHHAAIGGSAAVVHRTHFEIVSARSLADESPRPNAPACSIASPRGPPLVA
jgi:hypothetical protein